MRGLDCCFLLGMACAVATASCDSDSESPVDASVVDSAADDRGFDDVTPADAATDALGPADTGSDIGQPCKKLGEQIQTGQSVMCCADLKLTTPKGGYDTNCNPVPYGSYQICIACGDGTCDIQYESSCNCSGDCPK